MDRAGRIDTCLGCERGERPDAGDEQPDGHADEEEARGRRVREDLLGQDGEDGQEPQGGHRPTPLPSDGRELPQEDVEDAGTGRDHVRGEAGQVPGGHSPAPRRTRTISARTTTPKTATFQFRSRSSMPALILPAVKRRPGRGEGETVYPRERGLECARTPADRPGGGRVDHVDIPEGRLVRRENPASHGPEDDRGGPEDEEGAHQVVQGVGLVCDRVRQEGIERGRVDADQDAEGGGAEHARLHEPRRVRGLDLARAEEGEVAELEEREERPEGGDLEEHPEPDIRLFGREEDHPLRDVAVEEGHPGDRERGHPERERRDGHPFLQAAEPREEPLAGLPDDDPHHHEEERLVQDVVEDVGHPAVQAQLPDGAGRPQPPEEPDAGDHVADLGDDMVGEKPAHVVLEDGEDDAVDGHQRPHEGDVLRPGGRPRQEVDRGLGRVHAQEDARHEVRPRVGVREPGVERDERAVHPDTEHDQDRRPELVRRVRDPGQGPDDRRAASQEEQGDAGDEKGPAEPVEEEVAVPGADRLAPLLPDQEGRGDRHELPDDEQGDPVPGKDRAERGACVQEGEEVETGRGDRRRVDDGEQGDDPEDHPDQVREAVDPQEREGEPHEGHVPEDRALVGGGGYRRVRSPRSR